MSRSENATSHLSIGVRAVSAEPHPPSLAWVEMPLPPARSLRPLGPLLTFSVCTPAKPARY